MMMSGAECENSSGPSSPTESSKMPVNLARAIKTVLLAGTLATLLLGSAASAHPLTRPGGTALQTNGGEEAILRGAGAMSAPEREARAQDDSLSVVMRRRRRRSPSLGSLRGSSRTGAIAGLVMLALLVVAVTLVLCFCWKRRSALRSESISSAKQTAANNEPGYARSPSPAAFG